MKMTIEQFDKTGFAKGDLAIYKGDEYQIKQVDFEERLFGLMIPIEGADDENITWVRCENVIYISVAA